MASSQAGTCGSTLSSVGLAVCSSPRALTTCITANTASSPPGQHSSAKPTKKTTTPLGAWPAGAGKDASSYIPVTGNQAAGSRPPADPRRSPCAASPTRRRRRPLLVALPEPEPEPEPEPVPSPGPCRAPPAALSATARLPRAARSALLRIPPPPPSPGPPARSGALLWRLRRRERARGGGARR